MEFSPELRSDVLAGEITLSVRLTGSSHVLAGAGPIEADTLVYRIEFHAVSPTD